MKSNRSIPESTVIPVLVYPDVAQAAAWLCAAFGFAVRLRIADHRIQLNVGEGAVVVKQGVSSTGSDSVMVRVENMDEHHACASQHGAKILAAPAEYPYGERQYTAQDFTDRIWTFSESVRDVDPRDWGGEPVQL
jgi:uncharacterized glyoxalase superfamily protein PhnB